MTASTDWDACVALFELARCRQDRAGKQRAVRIAAGPRRDSACFALARQPLGPDPPHLLSASDTETQLHHEPLALKLREAGVIVLWVAQDTGIDETGTAIP